MFTIVKEFHFDAAHLLDGHDGKCKNLHGHTYKLQVELKNDTLIKTGPKRGMVLDFAEFNLKVKQFIIDYLDHAFLYDKTSTHESKIAEILLENNSKVFGFSTRTTAEELSKFIYNELHLKTNLPISKIRLWETPQSFCEYE